ncbi:hypothetical protein HOS75_gp048 [Gordonia phage SteveFrench]|uniref:Uncharacterized protein n=2 Tax=Montyvirus stevefrench TaxID=2734258 RepID=A0A890UPX6_9CAUD|nr:hypothetical protein HOS75_gp048 [Gordonia phage SteveFrench]AUV60682.1 hypothetical protein SEA_STEVEFRENCH_80 [Gordonia phage SteveFrench]QRI45665.1 hypothetical protein SEA_ROYALG_81 [Gordonia phage RoyalG]
MIQLLQFERFAYAPKTPPFEEGDKAEYVFVVIDKITSVDEYGKAAAEIMLVDGDTVKVKMNARDVAAAITIMSRRESVGVMPASEIIADLDNERPNVTITRPT